MKSLVALALMMLLALNLGIAKESMGDLAQNKELKARIVSALEAQIAKHEKMSKDQILADIKAKAEKRQSELLANGKKVAIDMESLNALDKEDILALESAQLQDAMSSTNMMFFLTKLAVEELEYVTALGADFEMIPVYVGDTILLVAAIGLDIALLPFTFTASAITGF